MSQSAWVSAVTVLLWVASMSPAAEVYTDGLVAVVNGVAISDSEVWRKIEQPIREMRVRLAQGEIKREQAAAKAEDFWRAAVEALIDEEVLNAEFKALKATVPRDLVQRRANRIIRTEAAGNREKLEERLRQQGMTWDEFEEEITKGLAVEILIDNMVRRKVHVSPEEVDAYYAKNPQLFVVPNRLRLEAVFLKKDGRYAATLAATRQEIMDKAKQKPQGFGELASQYSEHTSAAKGGDLGWMEESTMRREFVDAVRNLNQGEVAAPLELADGVYILRLAEIERGRSLPLDSATRQRIEEVLRRQDEDRRYRDLLDRLYVKYQVIRHYPSSDRKPAAPAAP